VIVVKKMAGLLPYPDKSWVDIFTWVSDVFLKIIIIIVVFCDIQNNQG